MGLESQSAINQRHKSRLIKADQPSIVWIKFITHSSSFGPSLECPMLESSQISWISPLSASLIFLDLALVIGLTGTCNWSLNALWFSSFPLSSKGFVLESSPTSKRERSETLNVALMLYSPGRSNLYALSLILSRTWNGPSPLGYSFDHLRAGNLSFLICTQTQSPGSKRTCRRPLLALVAYCSFFFSICYTFMEFLHHLSLLLTIQTSHFINW